MVANTLGQCGSDCLGFLWLMADYATQTQHGFSLDDLNNSCSNEHIFTSQQAIDYQRVRGKKFHRNRLRLLTCIFEAITERLLGVTNTLHNSNTYKQWSAQLASNLSELWLIFTTDHFVFRVVCGHHVGFKLTTFTDGGPLNFPRYCSPLRQSAFHSKSSFLQWDDNKY